MKPKYIQINCAEEKEIDLRQAKAVLRYKPDLIFLEYPTNSLKSIKKPIHINKKIILKFPWTESDNYMWANIEKIWKNGHNTLVYAIDGPYDLVNKANIYLYDKKHPYKTTDLFWWVRIYLRECFMARNIMLILKKYKKKKNPIILVFVQNFHWRHVKFLLSNHSEKAIWNYYFKRFRGSTSIEISRLVKKENKILFKYWNSLINLCR